MKKILFLFFIILTGCQSNPYTPDIWKSELFKINNDLGCFKIIEEAEKNILRISDCAGRTFSNITASYLINTDEAFSKKTSIYYKTAEDYLKNKDCTIIHFFKDNTVVTSDYDVLYECK